MIHQVAGLTRVSIGWKIVFQRELIR